MPHWLDRPFRASRVLISLVIAAALTVGLLADAGVAGAAPTPVNPGNPGSVAPSNPTDQDLRDSDAQKAAANDEVGRVSGQIAEAQARLHELQVKLDLAEQDVAFTMSKYREAVDAVAASKRAMAAAQRAEEAERVRFAQYMQDHYAAGELAGTTGNLLTADDPSAMLRANDYEQYETDRQAGAVGRMELVTLHSSNTKAAAARAETAAKEAKKKAEAAQREAEDAVADQQSEEAGLQDTLEQRQVELVAARQRQAGLYKDRASYNEFVRAKAAYNAFLAEKARIAREAAIRKAKIAAAKKRAEQEAAAERRAEAREKAAEAKAEAKAKAKAKKEGKKYVPKKKTKKKKVRSDDEPRDTSPAPSSGGWTEAKGKLAVKRAKKWLGTMYAWAGGNRKGPTYGVCTSGAASGDCYVKGFDCSGLVLYAWGARWDHLAHNQWRQAGSYHPKRSKLKPGDLMFFGGRGGGARLHHVAIYVGNGKMIEAPQSNSEIRITDADRYGDYYGATRPLT